MTEAPKIGDILITNKDHGDFFGCHAVYEVIDISDIKMYNMLKILRILPDDICEPASKVTMAYYEKCLVNIS